MLLTIVCNMLLDWVFKGTPLAHFILVGYYFVKNSLKIRNTLVTKFLLDF